jgi:hypothetical protein
MTGMPRSPFFPRNASDSLTPFEISVRLLRSKIKKLTKAVVAENLQKVEDDKKVGGQRAHIYWTQGRCDAVAIFEAPNERSVIKMAIDSRITWPSKPLLRFLSMKRGSSSSRNCHFFEGDL